MGNRPYTPTTRSNGQTPIDDWWNDLQDVVDEVDDDLATAEATLVKRGSSTIFGTYFEPFPFHTVTGHSGMSANTAYGLKFRVDRAFTATAIKVYCKSNAGGGNVDANIYSESGGTYTRLAGASTPVAAAANSLRTITLASSIALATDTDYWAFVAVSSGSDTYLRHQCPTDTAVAADGNNYVNKGSSYPLTSTITSVGNNQNFIWVRIVGTFT